MTDMPSTSLSTPKKKRSLYDLDVPRYIGWLLYDVANTFYAAGVLTLMALTWFLVRGQQSGFSYGNANAVFSYTLSIASIFMAVMLPVLGALSDVTNERKRYVLFFTFVCLASTAGFALIQDFTILLIFFSISLIAYQWAQVFYDAMLPGVVPPGREAKLSSLAIAIGYIGGAGVVLYASILDESGANSPNADLTQGSLTLGYFPSLIALIIAGFFLLSIPLIFVRETNWQTVSKEVEGDTIEIEPHPGIWSIVRSSFGELKDTFINIYENNRGMFFYILAYFIIADIANLIVLINAPFLRDALKAGENTVITATVVTGASIVLFSYAIGMICDRYGAKRGFQTIGVLWMVGLTIFMLTDVVLPFEALYIGAAVIGPAFSGVWISQRQMVLELVPSEQEIGRYFGLTKFSGKISSAVGPALWGTLLLIFSEQLRVPIRIYIGQIILLDYIFTIGFSFNIETSYRFAILGMTVFLLIGFLILHFFVPNNHLEFKKRKQKLVEALKSMDQT